MSKFNIEVTDTFGGEANYCWVHRHKLTVPDNTSQRAIVKAAKALEGWTGLRCETNNMGETIEVRPRGLLQVMFINNAWDDPTFDEDETAETA